MSIDQDQCAGTSTSHSNSTTCEHLKSLLKLPPNNALEVWSKAGDFIRCKLVPLVIAEGDLFKKNDIFVENV